MAIMEAGLVLLRYSQENKKTPKLEVFILLLHSELEVIFYESSLESRETTNCVIMPVGVR